ncbi:MAG TPA: hypothetical protein VLH39_03080, partial [Magnetospirillaceae bacterium]|nr:hypothetical protein [Magnetospirillaceae bacterium]
RRFHAAASRQRALKFEFTGPVIPAADMAAVRFIEPAAVGDYRAFAFFARSTESVASIAIKLEGAVEALYVEVPAADLSESWRRFVVRYDGLPRLYSQDGEGRPETPVPGAVVRADPSASAGKITITVTATGDGSVFVDELHFLDSAGEFSLSGRGSLSWSRPGPAAQSGALSIVSDPGFSARLSGTASEHPGFAGNVAGSAGFGPLRVSANLRQGWSDGRFEGGAFGHSLELPLDWFAASDSFEHEPASGRFGRRNAISLKGRGLGLSLEQSAAYGAGRLVQNWDLRLTAGSFLSLAGKASNSADGALDLPDEYGKAWIEAFRYALPTLEDFSSRRTSDLAVAFAAGGGRLALTAGSSLREAASLNPAGTSTAEARLGWSFPLGRGIIEPYYRRVWSRSSISGSGGFFGDWEAWASDLSRSDFLLSAVPFAELFDGSTSDLFLMSAAGTSSARYAPEAGVALSRRFGSRWTDLILPSRAVFSLKRELTSSLDTAAEALVAELSASMAAVNLFGSQGVYRATSIYAVDEFAQHVTASASWHDGGQDPLLALAHTAFASFHTGREDTLVAENRVDIKESRDGLAWSERLSLSLTVRPDRTWLGDLVSRLKDRRDTAGRGPAGGNIVSGF